MPQTAPSVTDQTPAQFENENGLAFRVNAVADGTSIKTVKLAFKDNTLRSATASRLSAERQGLRFLSGENRKKSG